MEALNHHLFIDIETACGVAEHAQLSPGMQREWEKKSKTKWGEEADSESLYTEKAGIFAEFGRVVCISMGCLVERDRAWKLLTRSFAGNDERELLERFCISLQKFNKQYRQMSIVGHNIAEFDLPYLCRRMIINGMQLPDCINFQGKKPWELKELIRDTMQLWSFGDYKSFTKLSLLAEVLGIPTPKDDISGEDVTRVFWQERDLQRIITYCQKDVDTTARVFLRLTGRSDIDFTVEIFEEKVAA